MKASGRVYVSTGAFQTTNIDEIISLCLDYGIEGLELSSGGVSLSPKTLAHLERLVEAKKLSVLLHNYFPAPQTPFVLNLAAMDADILEKSRDHCYRAIRLCRQLGSPFYSVHAGFCYHAVPHKLGGKQTDLPRISKREALRVFADSIALLADYAAGYHVGILIENNVLTKENLVGGGNDLMLGVTAADFICWMKEFAGLNVFTLLDVAHLKVTASTLGFDAAHEFKAIAPYIRAVHLSDNDSQRDDNRIISSMSWFWPYIEYIGTAAYILEVYDLTPEKIKEQLDIVTTFLHTTVGKKILLP